MAYKIISYLKFLIQSTNQHGVHSPFVYNFVTKGLYTKTEKAELINDYSQLKNLSRKENKVLSKIIMYFKINKIYFKNENFVPKPTKNLCLVFLKEPSQLQSVKASSNSFIVVKDIYKTNENNSYWRNYLQENKNIVTVNTFIYGIIFFRSEQAKEHFIIRV